MVNKLPEHLPWKRIRSVGQGGQAHVYEVERKNKTSDDTRYALKQLSRQDHPQAIARFVREIESLKKVRHTGIVEVVDHSSEKDEFQYYVMPYVDGCRTLDSLIQSEDSPFKCQPRAVLRFVSQCCEALAAVHETGIVHRDLNPRNILVRPDLSPIIIDFGCIHVEDGAVLTLVDEAVGARNYTAPECEAGGNAGPTTASDIYSLGKVMWSMVSGRRAFSREKPAFGGQRLSKVLPDHPQSWLLTDILRQTTRTDPRHRFQGVAELRDACDALATQVDDLVPLELVADLCPRCGGRDCLERSKDRIDNPLKVHFDLLIRNSVNHPDLEGAVCHRCGFVFLQNVRPLREYESGLSQIE